ncbi:MAG: ABC transporter permease [Clostridia bacterium]|nr:ABC transporter permease [Clostridia bacterium]
MFKRDLKLFLKCLVSAAVLLLMLAAIFIGAAGALIAASEPSDELLRVAVVDNEDSVLSRILINTITNTDYLSQLITAVKTDEESAMRALENGNCAAVFILPEGFIDDIYRGVETHGRVYLSSGLSAQSQIVESAVRFGERLLASGQLGVFSGERILRERGITGEEYSSYVTKANTRLLAEALAANDRYFILETLSYDGTGMTSESYYLLCWLLMLLFMLSLFFVPLFRQDCTQSMLARLRSCGVGGLRFMGGKLTLMLMLRVLIILAAVTALSFGFNQTLNTVMLIPSSLLCAAYITLLCACLVMCFGDGITVTVIISIGGMFLCGGLVPRQLLPDTLLMFGEFTPLGAAKALLSPIFGAAWSPIGMVCAVGYSLIAILLISKYLRIGGNAHGR